MELETRRKAKIEELRRLPGPAYLGSPYTDYPMGREAAFYDVTALAAKLADKGIRTFAPITMSHSIAKIGRLDAVDAEFWEWFDRPFVELCPSLIVACLPSWQESKGLSHEIATFLGNSRPVVYIDPQEI